MNWCIQCSRAADFAKVILNADQVKRNLETKSVATKCSAPASPWLLLQEWKISRANEEIYKTGLRQSELSCASVSLFFEIRFMSVRVCVWCVLMCECGVCRCVLMCACVCVHVMRGCDSKCESVRACVWECEQIKDDKKSRTHAESSIANAKNIEGN